MDRKLGVYLCSGCGIGDALDVGALSGLATKQRDVAICRTDPFLCGVSAATAIADDVREGRVERVIIGACSPRAQTAMFPAAGGVDPERVNLREHVAWCHEPRHEDTQALAEDYLRMALVRVRQTEPPQPLADPISETLLVVGGGVTGMSAALGAAEAGHPVVLVEQAPGLGGFVAGLRSRFPVSPPYEQLDRHGIDDLVAAVCTHPRIDVRTSTTIAATTGQPGMFDVTLASGESTDTVRAGAMVMATGWKPYDATKLGHLGYGLPNVVTNVEFERMAAAGPIVRADGRPVASALMIQCAGSRDPDHLPYCSNVCCMASLKHTVYLHEQNPDTRVYIVYRDLRTPGQQERFYREVQDQPLTFMVKGEVSGVQAIGDGRLQVSVNDSLLGESIALQVDLVVLATGMVPSSADGEAIRLLTDARSRAASAESMTQRQEAARKAEELKQHDGTGILHLGYRQGPDLPLLADGFPDSHFVCFPYETRRTGIYAAGALRQPMDSVRASEDAAGAALKAIQSIALAAEGMAVHPRTGDTSYPSFLLQRCTQCKRCTEECPFGALDEDEKGTPRPNLYRCRRCGICMGACPERIVSFRNYSVDMIANMIRAIEVPEEEEDKPRVLVFMCENDAYPALDAAGANRLRYDPSVRVIPLRCLGSLNIVWIADALSRGFDGVMLVGCRFGDDYQCHFIRGSELANRRLENVKETLQRLQLESERITFTELAIADYGRLPGIIDAFVERIREIGPNPYKGF